MEQKLNKMKEIIEQSFALLVGITILSITLFVCFLFLFAANMGYVPTYQSEDEEGIEVPIITFDDKDFEVLEPIKSESSFLI